MTKRGAQAEGPDPDARDELRVLIVEHETILREGLRRVVESAAGLRVVATAIDVEAALRALRSLHPNIVLIDARLPNRMGFFLTRATRREAPATRVVLLSDSREDALVELAAEAGAAAVVQEKIGADDLGAVLRTVAGSGVDFLGFVVPGPGSPPDPGPGSCP